MSRLEALHPPTGPGSGSRDHSCVMVHGAHMSPDCAGDSGPLPQAPAGPIMSWAGLGVPSESQEEPYPTQ